MKRIAIFAILSAIVVPVAAKWHFHGGPVYITNLQEPIGALARFGTAIAGGVSASATAVSTLIIQSTNQIIGTIEKQIKHDKELYEVVEDYDKQYRMQENAVKMAERTVVPPSVSDGAVYSPSIRDMSRGRSGMLRDMSASFVTENISTDNPIRHVAKTEKTHYDEFCSQEDFLAKRCDQAAPAEYQDIDLLASNLYDSESGVYDEKQAEAARLYISSVTNPTPSATVSRWTEGTVEGKIHYIRMLEEQRALSVAQFALQRAYVNRMKVKGEE